MTADPPIVDFTLAGHRTVQLVLLCGAGLAAIGCDRGAAPPPPGRVPRPGFAVDGDSAITTLTATNFDRKVLDAEQPVLVEFGSATCPPCARMAPGLERLASELAGRAIIGRVDFDDQRALAERFAIRTLPVFLLFDRGEFVERLDGERDIAELRRRLLARMHEVGEASDRE